MIKKARHIAPTIVDKMCLYKIELLPLYLPLYLFPNSIHTNYDSAI